MQPIRGTEANNQISGSNKEGNLPISPSGKLGIQQNMIQTFLVALALKLITSMILHQRISLKIKGNMKVTDKKVVRCVKR